MTELSPMVSKQFIKICSKFFTEHNLKPIHCELLIQQLEYEWHNAVILKRLMKNPEEIRELLKRMEEASL